MCAWCERKAVPPHADRKIVPDGSKTRWVDRLKPFNKSKETILFQIKYLKRKNFIYTQLLQLILLQLPPYQT